MSDCDVECCKGRNLEKSINFKRRILKYIVNVKIKALSLINNPPLMFDLQYNKSQMLEKGDKL